MRTIANPQGTANMFGRTLSGEKPDWPAATRKAPFFKRPELRAAPHQSFFHSRFARTDSQARPTRLGSAHADGLLPRLRRVALDPRAALALAGGERGGGRRW